MAKFLLDTSIIIEALRTKNLEAEEFLKEKYQGKIYISQITIGELSSGRSAQDKETADFLKMLIANFKITEVDTETSIMAGELRSQYNISMPDAYIAASAIMNDLILVTHNKKDFNKLSKLKIK